MKMRVIMAVAMSLSIAACAQQPAAQQRCEGPAEPCVLYRQPRPFPIAVRDLRDIEVGRKEATQPADVEATISASSIRHGCDPSSGPRRARDGPPGERLVWGKRKPPPNGGGFFFQANPELSGSPTTKPAPNR